ncbi:MAG: hypothetical protein C4B59_14670 [Candidatus Methanogaster sp.]|uniref:Uncharacterized protein n=1 Tax=Candidatus Methanogaster sp. TaxID=3386292 RepID=A0AC61KZ19_9EURY|nr:MAG: hypothetical protein C4B59_14670 [ANME-2 cluster archaeon]
MSNKNILLSIVVITMLALSTGVAWAGEETPADASGSVVKWRQPPDMNYGVNIRSTEVEPIVADDWKCTDPRPVTDVHFWGSYIRWETNNETPQPHSPGVDGFVIRIYEDVSAGVDQHYSHPGKRLYEEKVEKFEERYVASILHPDGAYEHKFYYSMNLPESFKQREGTIYWISIAAVMPEEYEYPWGWETSTIHWNDNTCRHWHNNDDWEEIIPKMLPLWYQEHYETVDLAFELTVGSEPPPPPEPIKWQQRPDMVQGINIISMPTGENRITVADDWLCLDGSPVSDLHFWGSYPGWHPDNVPRDPNTPPGVKEFRIRIYSDAPSDSSEDFSRPNKLLYEVWVDGFDETYQASILLPWGEYEHKYRYDLDLPEPFLQKRDTIYWLSIAAVTLNHTYPWGWESSMDRWNDFAVQGWCTDDNSEWKLITHPWTERPINMAFELTTREGPIKWLQFPDMADGVNIISLPENHVVADDWLCTDGKAIDEVHFWGSYLSREEEKHWEQDNPGPPEKLLPPTPGVSGFKLSFHRDIPARVDPDMPWSHPGELLREVWVDSDEFRERYWDSVPHIDASGNIWWEHKFYYIVRLEEPFKQKEGTIYWLDIGAKPMEEKWFWGWETSKDHWNDNAVRGKEGGWYLVKTGQSQTMNFEDLTFGTEYCVGDTFTTSGVPVVVEPFQRSDGTWPSDGHATVENGGQAGGSGNEMNTNNVNLDFGIGAPIKSLSLLFGEHGGNLNIEINGDFRNCNNFADINGLGIGEVHVSVSGLGNDTGRLTLTGTIEQFTLGGQELWIDDVDLEKQVDMAFALTTTGPDLGDAPDSTNSFPTSMTAYPGVQANFPTVYQAGSPPHGPIHHRPKAMAFLGRRVTLEDEADIGPDEDGVNNLNPPNDAANFDGADDGVSMPLTLVHCENNTFDYVVTVVNPLYRSIYANVWFDWNQDGDWDDTMNCSAGGRTVLAPEWAVQNQQLQLSSPGVFTITTPRFMAWRYPAGAVHDGTWMRITLSKQKWDPIAGVHGAGGSGPVGGYQYGETEDYYVRYSQQPENTKWVQLPDLTPNGIDIKVDELRNIADDFECTSQSLLTDVHFWGSWRDDKKGKIRNIRLSIHSDDPVGLGGSDKENKFSKPDEQLWKGDFGPDEFGEMLYYTATDRGEWWWDPASREGAIPDGDKNVWRYDIKIDPDEAFLQRGTRERPIIYWLYIVVETESEDYEFGWKTREYPDHFMDDAVWDYGSELPRSWKELRYPLGHPYHELERNSIDMAFALTFEGIETLDWGDAPGGVTAPGYPTLATNNGARHTIVPGFHLGRTIRISQELSPGVGDFDANVLGYIAPYATSLSTAGYYQYGTPYGASFNGPAPMLTSNRSHLFLADTTDGLSLFVVHDKPEDGCGGTAAMKWTLAGDTANVLALDDPWENVTVSGGGTIFESSHGWMPCCTDGMALGSLDGAWTIAGAFINAIDKTGMDEWHVHSSDGSSIALAFEKDLRVRLDYQRPIDPDPDGQPDPNALGDDNDGNDDENGVVFNTPLIAGQQAEVTVFASTQGLLQGWIDFNADRDWADTDEQIFLNKPLIAGPNVLTFDVPVTPTQADAFATFARFRFSRVRDLSFEGPARGGEVEDYEVRIKVRPTADLGDAPDSTNSFTASMTAYPGVSANFPTVYGAGSPPHGPIHRQPKALAFLGKSVSLESEADIGPDEDGVNNLYPPNDEANHDVSDDGVNMPLVLVHCEPNTFEYVVTVVNPLQRSVYVNVWFDWNRDGDWDDVMKCPESTGTVPATAPEWAVQNQQLHLSGPGVFTFTTPRFVAWLPPQVEAKPSARWMRITLSERKWAPFVGTSSAVILHAGGSGPAGGYRYGETEDYPVKCVQSQPNTKWVQLPDLTPNGIDIKVDDMCTLADDFRCTSPSLLTDVHFWGSWKHDDTGKIKNIHLSIHSDDPVGIGGSDKENKFSKPDELLWKGDFGPDEFEESLYHTATDRGEWWWDPAKEELIEGGDKQVWRYDIKIKPDEAFLQRGTRERPIIYWLDIRVTTESEECEFGWKTRQWPDHFMDDAVCDRGSELPRIWNELRYPKGHPYHGIKRDSIDMAFMLTFEELDWGDVPDPRYPTLRGSNGARHIIDPRVHLGRWVEADEDGQPSVGAIGDDINDGTDDEDGVAIPPLRVGATTRIRVFASVNGYLNAWFDWNADGDWDDKGEYVIAERPISAGPSLHNIRVPGGAEPGSSYARFRFSTRPLSTVLPAPEYEGRAPDGEVEDYRFRIYPIGPDHFEPNDNFQAAFDLGSLNQTRTGLGIHEPGEEDWFKWTALHNGQANFSVTGNVTLELYDSDGGRIATAGPDKCAQYTVVADESYYVLIRAADSSMTVLDYGWKAELCGDSDNYALLFSGGARLGKNHARYYNNIKEMYELLVDDYDLDPDKIWILYADGTNPAADRSDGLNSDMSYVATGTTVLPGTQANLESVLTTTLPGPVDSNDHFLFYAFDHGGGADNAPATTGEEVLTGWGSGDNADDDELEDWLNQVGAGHTTIVHTQCFAGGMLDDLLPLTSSTFGCAATNHYEGSYGDGFAGAFASALNSGYENAHDAYVYAHDHDPYAITRGTYLDNGGTWTYGKEHPWAASTSNFLIFAEDDDSMLKFVDDDIMHQYPKFRIGPYPPCDPLRVTHDMLLAKGMFSNDGSMGFRIEAVNSGSLTKNGKPVVPGKTMIGYGDNVVWTPPAPVNLAEDSGEFEGIIDAFTVRAFDGATVSDNSVTITVAADSAGELDAINDTVEIDEDARDVVIDVLANDSGNGTLVVAGVGQPQRGVALLAEGHVSYTPGPNFHGSDQFTYAVADSTQNTDMATVTVVVRSVNDPPEAYDDHLIVVMNSVNNTIDVLVNDYDLDPDPLTALPDSIPESGSMTMNADGTFSYTPDAGYTGSDSFTYLADDGTDQSMATVMITVIEGANSDWGDAPEFSGSMGGGYPTRAINGGANHTIGGPWFGEVMPDGEADGQPHSVALGDDNNNIDDEDGVSIPGLQQGKTTTIEIVVGGGGGYVDAWIDWNGNHLWEHSQEQIHAGHLPEGAHTISVSVPDTSITGQTFARFRISSAGGLTPAGSAPDGEVEDYEVHIQVSHGCGDLNEDGKVTAADAVIALEIAAGSRPFDAAADVSGDGIVTSLDALMILQAAADAIEIC